MAGLQSNRRGLSEDSWRWVDLPCTMHHVYYTVYNLTRSNLVKGEFSKSFTGVLYTIWLERSALRVNFIFIISQYELKSGGTIKCPAVWFCTWVCIHASNIDFQGPENFPATHRNIWSGLFMSIKCFSVDLWSLDHTWPKKLPVNKFHPGINEVFLIVIIDKPHHFFLFFFFN